VVDLVAEWQEIYQGVLGHRLVFAADEYYLLAGRPFPPAESYEGFPMHEDGIGMARNFELEFSGASDDAIIPKAGFFAWVDGAPAEGYRAPRQVPAGSSAGSSAPCGVAVGPVDGSAGPTPAGSGGARVVQLRPSSSAPVAILTSGYGALVLGPILAEDPDGRRARLVVVENRFFGGNIAVTGLMVGADVARVLAGQPVGHRYLLPDVCLSGGRFLDGMSLEDLPRPVEVVETSGTALREALRRGGVAGLSAGRRDALVGGRR
jgi:hypothetical protein